VSLPSWWFELEGSYSHEDCRSVQISPSAGAMSATLHASPSWLGSLAQSSPSPIDTRFTTFTAKTSSPRARGTVTAGLFAEDQYRAVRRSVDGSLDNELGDLEGIGIATNGAWSITINEGSRTRLRARKVRSGAGGGCQLDADFVLTGERPRHGLRFHAHFESDAAAPTE
jgi:hypothetical protein